jgi:hypothetical protein
MSGPSKKLYVYELVLSRSEYKKLAGRRLLSDKQWRELCESLSDALESAAGSVIKRSGRAPK